MTTITLKINKQSKAGKLMFDFIELITKQPGVEILEDKIPNEETIKAIEDAYSGKTTKVKNSKELFKNLGI